MGNAHPIDGRPQSEVQVGPDKLEVVASFCYLGDMLSAGGGCEMAVTTRVKTAWKKFRELLPVLTSRHLSYKTRGHVYSSCVRSAMLHASETWPLTKTNLQRLQRNDRAMIRQICSIKPEDVARVRSSELLAKLQLEDLDLILREGFAGLGMWRVRVVQSEHHMICRLTAGGGQGGPSKHGRNWQRKTAVSGSSPQLTLKKGAPGDQVWDLLCVQLASYLERGPLMWMMHLHVNQKSDYDDDDEFRRWLISAPLQAIKTGRVVSRQAPQAKCLVIKMW